MIHFNSRPHGGRPARSAQLLLPAHFNSRPHGGRPSFAPAQFRQKEHFNSRPHGGRLLRGNQPENTLYFNSRPHGGRRNGNREYKKSILFQLTPSRRATFYFDREWAGKVFQLTPSRRATFVSHLLFMIQEYFNSRPHGGRPFHRCREEGRSNFNSRPHGGRHFSLRVNCSVTGISTHALTEGDSSGWLRQEAYCCISTHALTEGDGKFRQIFLLNRGYAYSISLYFLPHFISLLPQILSFQQKSFKFQVRIFLLFSVHLAFALQNQCVHHVKSRFCTNMFYFVFVLFTQIVKPQTIGLFIYDFF